MGNGVTPLSRHLDLVALHPRRQDVPKPDVSDQFVHVEDIVNSGRVLALGIEFDTLYLSVRPDPVEDRAVMDRSE